MDHKIILVAPLDWGLGHATRCIPVIRELLANGHEVLIAAEGPVAVLLKEEFPALRIVHLKGYGLAYSQKIPAWLKIIFQLPKIFFRVLAEHAQLKKIIRQHKIDVVISDNRFGLWNKNTCSVYITHQVMIKCPPGLKAFEPVLHAIHRRVIKKYDRCWIPDYAGQANLSGDLSHKYSLPKNAKFINPLSRFAPVGDDATFEYDLCAVISGPEPARSEFEKMLRARLKNYSGKSIIILGKPGGSVDLQEGASRIVSHLPAAALEKVMRASRKVICRSGYSGVMDLIALRKDAILVPTPGQTEQEYLATYLSANKIFEQVQQSSFALTEPSSQNGVTVKNFNCENNSALLKKAVERLTDCG
jgi:UDP:flavonoid glycosyltransferase YjiC (YdhE family)